MPTKPYQLEKSLLDANKIQGLKAPSENAFHQFAPIPDYFLINTELPNSQIKPNFDFVLDSLLLFSESFQSPDETMALNIVDESGIQLYSREINLPSNNLLFDDLPKFPISKGSRIELVYLGAVNDTFWARLAIKRVFINEI